MQWTELPLNLQFAICRFIYEQEKDYQEKNSWEEFREIGSEKENRP